MVNLPERHISRKRYNPEYYSRYEELLEASLRGLPWFDLRLELDDDQFHDSEHANVGGAEHLTRTVIGLMQAHGLEAESTP